MIEKVFAGVLVAVCAVLLARLALGEPRRQILDRGVQRRWQACRRWFAETWLALRHRKRAAREADDVIRRARRGVRREGNVIHPESFESPRKPH